MKKPFRDRFFLTRLTRDERKVRIALIGITVVLLLLLANMFYLTIQTIKKESPVLPSALPLTSPTPSLEPSIITPTITSTVPVQAPVQTGSAVKEYFVTLGSGSSQASDWTDVPGLTAQIDFGSYTGIKEIHFEASVGIPTANETASVRLFNVTDKHPVWYSEITLVNGQFVSSNPIIYDTGSKLYQVQMKTSLQFMANLIQSRIHVILK